MSHFLFLFCLMRVSVVFVFTAVKRKLKLAADVEADFFEIEVGHYIAVLVEVDNFEFATRKGQTFQLRTTAKIRH